MSEMLLASATADVMFYEDSTKQWVRPSDNGTLTSINGSAMPDAQKFSNVQLLQGSNKTLFRIVAKRIFDGRTLIEQTIFQKLKYQAATKCFHQWRNEHRQVFGLSFSNEQDAEKFLSFVQNALECISSLNDYHYHALNSNANYMPNMNGNSSYQEPIYYQQQQSNNEHHYKDADQDSVGSSSGGSHACRKFSYSANVTNGINAMPSASSNGLIPQLNVYQQQQLHSTNIQRRASQGSNSSSNNSTNGLPNANGIYATSNSSNACHPNLMGINRLNITGPPGNPHVSISQPTAQSSSNETTTLSSTCSSSSGISSAPPPAPPLPPMLSSSVPPISCNVPPPPPPPPPPPFLKVGSAKPMSLADSLKQAKLRNTASSNTTNGVNRTSNSSADTGIGSKNSTISSTNSGHTDLLSELAATIHKRKTTAEGKPTDLGEKRLNGDSAPASRPWQKMSNASTVPTNASSISSSVVDSPRVQRKTINNASLSSQEEPRQSAVINGTTVSNAPATLIDLEKFKQDIILELNKTKQEILNAVRLELTQFHQNN